MRFSSCFYPLFLIYKLLPIYSAPLWLLISPFAHHFPSPLSPPPRLPFCRLAQTGEGILECELVRWYVAEGDSVDEFGRVCEVQSDKATIEITSPWAGVVKRLRHAVGDTVPVGDVLAEILVPEGEGGGLNAVSATGMVSGAGGAAAGTSLDQSISAVPVESAAPLEGSMTSGEAVETSPAVRRLARELGIDLAAVVPTGPGGRVTKGDLMAFVEASQAAEAAPVEQEAPVTPPLTPPAAPAPDVAAAAAAVAPGEPVVVPLRGYRKAMFKAMTSVAAIPHFHYCDEVSADTMVELRARLQGSPALRGARLTFMPFFIKAAAMALAGHPGINASVAPEGDAVIQHAHVNIGVAVATPLGLVVPNIKNIAALSVADIARELARLTAAAAGNQLRPDDVSGATFTISNIGVVGGTYATPLINPPEVAIMALGRIQRLPRFDSDSGTGVREAHVLGMTLGADHRVVDGAALAGFGMHWKGLVEDPARLLLELR